MAPIGLIASLLLCIATLLITSSVPTAIGAFAAASCACVAVSNMLSVNLPISRLGLRSARDDYDAVYRADDLGTLC